MLECKRLLIYYCLTNCHNPFAIVPVATHSLHNPRDANIKLCTHTHTQPAKNGNFKTLILMESSIRQWTISKAGCEGAHEMLKAERELHVSSDWITIQLIFENKHMTKILFNVHTWRHHHQRRPGFKAFFKYLFVLIDPEKNVMRQVQKKVKIMVMMN